MQTDLDAYFEHLRSERQVSPHTLDGYRRDLAKVVTFCDKQQLA
jgi:integrase/recombinase XerC